MTTADRIVIVRDHPVLVFAGKEYARHKSWAEDAGQPMRIMEIVIGTWTDMQERRPDCLQEEALRDMQNSRYSDDYFISETEGCLVLSGRSERATLYAVYQYAADRWGIRWIYPGEGEPTIEQKASLTAPEDYVMHSPDFERRGFVFETIDDLVYMNAMVDWLAKNKINEIFFTFMLWDRIGKHLADEIKRRGLKVTLGGHSMKFFLNRDSGGAAIDKAAHPYTAKLRLNYSDNVWQDQLLDDLAAYCQEVPGLSRVSLWPEDVADQGAGFLPEYTVFTEKLRERLHRAGLSIAVEHIAYNAGLSWHMLERGATKPSSDVDTLIAYWGRDYRSRLNESPHQSDKRAQHALADWASALRQTGRSLTVFEYYSDHFMLSPLFPALPSRISEDIGDYKSLGACGIVNLVVPCRAVEDYPWEWNHGFNSYVFCRSLWGDSLETILQDYYTYYPSSERTVVSALFEAIEGAAAGLTSWNFPLFPARAVDPEQAQASPEEAEAVIAMLEHLQAEVGRMLNSATLDRQGGPYRYARHLVEMSAQLADRWRLKRRG